MSTETRRSESPPDGPVEPAKEIERAQRSERRTLALMLTAVFVYLCIVVFWPPWGAGEPPPVERSEDAAQDVQIDVNQAGWAELMQLPGVGPKLAERILADREANGPFRNAADLVRVRGVGPKLLQQIAPYVKCSEEKVLDERR